MQVLLLGGHGKVALHLTPLLLNRAWSVTSVVRNLDHEKEILALGKGRKGNLKVLISNLADVKSAADAQEILNGVMPDYVVWSAGRSRRPSLTFRPEHIDLPTIRERHRNQTFQFSKNEPLTNSIPPQAPAAKAAPPPQSPSTKKPQSTS